MKKVLLIVFPIALLFMLGACNTVENTLLKKTGRWKLITETIRNFIGGVEDTSFISMNNYTIAFNDIGLADYTDFTDSTFTVSWEVNEEEDSIAICQDVFGTITCTNYFIKESKAKSQTWVSRIDFGGSDYSEIEDVLERQD